MDSSKFARLTMAGVSGVYEWAHTGVLLWGSHLGKGNFCKLVHTA